MENSPGETEKESSGQQPSTSSTFEGKTFIITPDKIARMGLIEQIKSVFNAQVAPKISQHFLNTVKTKTSTKTLENKSSDCRLSMQRTDDKDRLESTDCVQLLNNNTVSESSSSNALDYVGDDNASLNKKIKVDGNNAILSKRKNVGNDIAISNKRRKLMFNKNKTRGIVSRIITAKEKADTKLNRCDTLQSLNDIMLAAINETGESSDIVDRLSINNNTVGVDSACKKVSPIKRNIIKRKLINTNRQRHVQSIASPQCTNEKEVDISEVTHEKESAKSTAIVSITDAPGIKPSDISSPNLNDTSETKTSVEGSKTMNKIHVISIESVFLPAKDLKEITQSGVPARVLGQLSKSNDTTNETIHGTPSTTPSSKSKTTAETVFNSDKDTLEDSVNKVQKFDAKKECEIPVKAEDVEKVEITNETEKNVVTTTVPKKRGRKRKSDLEKIEATKEIKIPMVANEHANMVIETKRIRKKKFDSEYITDKEYDNVMKMAEIKLYSPSVPFNKTPSPAKTTMHTKKYELIQKTEPHATAKVNNNISELSGTSDVLTLNLSNAVKTQSNVHEFVLSINSEGALEVLSRIKTDVPSTST